MASTTPAPSTDDFQERKRHTATIARLLRSFIHVKNAIETDASFMETLVATILSQNTSDINSARAYHALREHYPTWDDVAKAKPHALAQVIRRGGLADQKARTILDVLHVIHARHSSYDPDHLEGTSDNELLAELTSLKGVGLKTAACVLMFSLHRDICAVDTHIHRVANRLGLVHTSNADKTFHALRPLIPKGKGRQFHVDTILFGRRMCKAQRPHCFECPLYDECAWPEKEAHAEAAQRGPAPASGDLLLTDMFPERKRPAAERTNAAAAAKQTRDD
ncbi:MAG: endonuclease III [Bacteroidetes bacterium]|nr:endonuclease III [Bacteroidota bacterium]